MSSTKQLTKQLKTPKKNEQRIGGKALRKIVESAAFYSNPRILDGGDIFYFYKPGDFIKGYLLSRHTETLTYYKQVMFKMMVHEMRQDGENIPIKYPPGRIAEFPGLKYLRKIIDKNELVGCLVRIVYLGREKSGMGHSAKVFDVFKDVGVASAKESYQSAATRKYKKRAPKKKVKKKKVGNIQTVK